MRKLTVIGLFKTGCNVADGQSVKTRIVTEELERMLGNDHVKRVDTYGWKKHPWKLLLSCAEAIHNSDNVLFLTDEGGIRVFPWLLQVLNFSGRCRLHYYVVGGWLKRYLDKSDFATKVLRNLDAVYVEIPAMARELEDRGFRNVVLVNKFRRMQPVNENELNMRPGIPHKVCFFSRVMHEKGIEDAMKAIMLANDKAGFEKYTLDVFGAVDPAYKEKFDQLLADTPECIRYAGIVDYQNSGHVLKEYCAMLFPTFYLSEGYPNVAVDAYAAGLPVIATRWQYNEDVIHDREDGILVDVGRPDQLANALEELVSSPETFAEMRRNALARCVEFLPENAISKVVENLK